MDDASTPYKGSFIKRCCFRYSKWMIENGYRNLIQGKQPEWAKSALATYKQWKNR
jgi:hypothetical protein